MADANIFEDTREEGPLSGPLGAGDERVNVPAPTGTALSTAAAQVVNADGKRKQISLQNADAAILMYIGTTSGLTTANGWPLAAGKTLTIVGYKGPIWAIAASGTPSLRALSTQQE